MAHGEAVRAIFRRCDVNGKGLIERELFVEVLQRNTATSIEQIRELLQCSGLEQQVVAGEETTCLVPYDAFLDLVFGPSGREAADSVSELALPGILGREDTLSLCVLPEDVPQLSQPVLQMADQRPAWSMLGVRLAVIERALARLSVGGRRCQPPTTLELRDDLIEPETRSRQCSYVELLSKFPADATLGQIDDVGPASLFWVHCWAAPLAEELAALRAYLRRHALDEGSVYIWFDAFSFRQHCSAVSGGILAKDLSDAFIHCIRAVGHTAVHIFPWRNPQVLSRAWPLCEVAWSLAGSAAGSEDLSVFPSASRVGFAPGAADLAALGAVEKFDELLQAADDIDIGGASCAYPQDHTSLLEAAERTGGAKLLGRAVAQAARSWLAEVAWAVVKARSAELGAAHPEVSVLENSLALQLQDMGRPADAEPLLSRALASSDRMLGEGHPHTLTYANNLGQLLLELQRPAEAVPLLRRALLGREAALSAEHPSTLTSASHLGQALFDLGRLADAEPLLMRALETKQRVLGPTHPNTAAAASSYSLLLKRNGRVEEATALSTLALEASEHGLGSAHSGVLRCVYNLGRLLEEKGDIAGAERLYRRAMEVRQETLGPKHPDTLVCVHNLGVLLQMQGRFSEAEPLLRHAMDGCERALGPGHPGTLTSAKNLVALLGQRHTGDTGSTAAERALFLTGCDDNFANPTTPLPSAELSLEVQNYDSAAPGQALETHVSEVSRLFLQMDAQNATAVGARDSAAADTPEARDVETYKRDRLNPVLDPMVLACVRKQPADAKAFMSSWLAARWAGQPEPAEDDGVECLSQDYSAQCITPLLGPLIVELLEELPDDPIPQMMEYLSVRAS